MTSRRAGDNQRRPRAPRGLRPSPPEDHPSALALGSAIGNTAPAQRSGDTATNLSSPTGAHGKARPTAPAVRLAACTARQRARRLERSLPPPSRRTQHPPHALATVAPFSFAAAAT